MNQIEHNGVIYKVGDTATVHRKVESNQEGGMGPLGNWENVWVTHMDEFIGKQLVIRDIGRGGILFKGTKFSFPLLSIVPNVAQLLLAAPIKVSNEPFQLKPWMRVVTRNGWQWIVAENPLLGEVRPTTLYLARESSQWTYIQWRGEVEDLDIVAVYGCPVLPRDTLIIQARGELLWTDTMAEEKAAKAALVTRLQQQRAELDARINELGVE